MSHEFVKGQAQARLTPDEIKLVAEALEIRAEMLKRKGDAECVDLFPIVAAFHRAQAVLIT